MEILDSRRSLLLVIDLQGKLMDVIDRPKSTLEAAHRLFRLAELFQVPVLMTEQYPQGLGGTHPLLRAAFDSLSTPKGELSKTSFGCCGDPGFEAKLAELLPGIPAKERQIVVIGIEAHVCVMATVLELLRSGHQVQVVWDAVSGRGAEYRSRAFDRMARAGAVLTNHESVGFEWARDKKHPKFKELSVLLREGQPEG